MEMASNDDTDDLYADLYGETDVGAGDSADHGAKGNDDGDLIGYEDPTEPANGTADGTSEKLSGGSFIPAAVAPPSSDRSNTQTRGSFIPPGSGSSAAPVSRDSGSNYAQPPVQQGIQTHHSMPSSMGEDRGGRPLMPRDMPEEG